MKLYSVTLTVINHETGMIADQRVIVMAASKTGAESIAFCAMDTILEKLRADTEIEIQGSTELAGNCAFELTDELEKYFNGGLTSDD